jgi:hypothetical protein
VKDVNLVLREKELDIVRVRKEVEALHLAIPLLADDQDWVEHGLTSPPPSQSQWIGTTHR